MPRHNINVAGGVSFYSLHFAILSFVLLPFVLRYLPRDQRTNAVWLTLTACAYCSGFLVVYCEARYLRPILLPVGLILTLQLVYVSGRRSVESASTGCWIALFRVSAAMLVLFSFVFATLDELKHTMAQPNTPTYRNVAAQLKTLKLSGNLASSDWGRGLFVAYHMESPYLGFPVDLSDQQTARKLKEYHAAALLVWPEPGSMDKKAKMLSQAERVVQGGGWKLAASIPVPVRPAHHQRAKTAKPLPPNTDQLRIYVPDPTAAPTTQGVVDPDEEMPSDPDASSL